LGEKDAMKDGRTVRWREAALSDGGDVEWLVVIVAREESAGDSRLSRESARRLSPASGAAAAEDNGEAARVPTFHPTV